MSMRWLSEWEWERDDTQWSQETDQTMREVSHSGPTELLEEENAYAHSWKRESINIHSLKSSQWLGSETRLLATAKERNSKNKRNRFSFQWTASLSLKALNVISLLSQWRKFEEIFYNILKCPCFCEPLCERIVHTRFLEWFLELNQLLISI